MNIRFHKTLIAAALFAAAPLALAQPGAASAQMHTNDGSSQMQKSHMMKHTPSMQHKMAASKMMGEHNMPAMVTSVDHKTGIVKVKSLGMDLTVHFPPPTIANLKTGDKISLHLGYKMSGGNSMMRHSM